MRVALFGGSFNPPHVAHVLATTYLLSIDAVDEVLVVPVFAHAFDKELAAFDDRLEMCRLALDWLPHVTVSDVERHLGAPSRTLRTVEHLQERHPDWRIRVVVGADVLGQVDEWHAFDEIVQRAPLLVLGRVGIDEPAAPPPVLPDISSTAIRDALARAEPDDWALLDRFLPAAVRRHIVARSLYRRDPP